MDYSKLVYAIQDNDTVIINEQITIITPILIKYLTVRVGATYHDAQDCVQNTLILAVQKIKDDKLESPDAVIYYLFTSAKNNYLKFIARKKESNYEEIPETYAEDGDQLYRLIDEEKQTILQLCLNKLKPNLKAYIEYWFNNPRNDASDVADHFGITVSNAWTKKHRVLNILKQCYQKNIES